MPIISASLKVLRCKKATRHDPQIGVSYSLSIRFIGSNKKSKSDLALSSYTHLKVEEYFHASLQKQPSKPLDLHQENCLHATRGRQGSRWVQPLCPRLLFDRKNPLLVPKVCGSLPPDGIEKHPRPTSLVRAKSIPLDGIFRAGNPARSLDLAALSWCIARHHRRMEMPLCTADQTDWL